MTLCSRYVVMPTDFQSASVGSRKLLQAYAFTGVGEFQELERSMRRRGLHPKFVRVHNMVAIPPASDPGYSKIAQTARAMPSHFSKPWFSDVAIRNGDGGEWYGKLCLLFTCETEVGNYQPFSFIRYYRECGLDRRTGCPILKWETGAFTYDVIELSCILRVVHVVKDSGQSDVFYLNIYNFH